MIQRPRYLLTPILMWIVFFFMKLYDDYDGILSLIGAPIVATFLLAITLPIVLVLGLIRRMPQFANFWYSGAQIPSVVLVASLVLLIFGHSLGFRERYTYTNSLGNVVADTKLSSFVSIPAFFLAAFSVLYWPRSATIHLGQHKKNGDDGDSEEAV